MKNPILAKNNFFILCLHKKSENKAVIIRPDLERFVCNLANEYGIELTDFGLPDNPKKLHDRLSGKQKKSLEYLERFFKKVLKSGKPLKTIKEFIQRKS